MYTAAATHCEKDITIYKGWATLCHQSDVLSISIVYAILIPCGKIQLIAYTVAQCQQNVALEAHHDNADNSTKRRQNTIFRKVPNVQFLKRNRYNKKGPLWAAHPKHMVSEASE